MAVSADDRKRVKAALSGSGMEMAVAVVQVYHCPQGASTWSSGPTTGLLALVHENSSDTDMFKLIDAEGTSVAWADEIYEGLEYKVLKPFFHVYEAEKEVVGFNFADVGEATKFKKMIDMAKQMASSKAGAGAGAAQTQASKGEKKKSRFGFGTIKGFFQPQEAEQEPLQISGPTDFEHKSHIGVDPIKGLDVKQLSPELVALFKKAHIRQKDLRNPEAAEFLLSVLTMAGVDPNEGAAGRAHRAAPPPPPSKHGPPPPPPPPGAPAPPPMPSGDSGQAAANLPPVDPQRGALLESIRAGLPGGLRKVPRNEQGVPDVGKMSQQDQSSLADVLARAMSDRRNEMGVDDEEEDDDWD